MDAKSFSENGFIIDLSNTKDAAEVIYELTSILEMPDAKNKDICLKLGDVELTQSQLLSVKAFISSMESELKVVDTTAEKTKESARVLGIETSGVKNEIEIKETEAQDAEIKEIEVGEPHDGLSYELEEDVVVDEDKELEVFDAEVESESVEEVEAEPVVEETAEEKLAKQRAFEEEIFNLPTLYLQQTLRSGQTMTYDGNVVLIGDTNPGSEIIAKGDITVWGIIGGIAHAGAKGNEFATIRALKINAIQLRISGHYARRPDTINIPYIQKTDTFTPEEAKVTDGEIAIYKFKEA